MNSRTRRRVGVLVLAAALALAGPAAAAGPPWQSGTRPLIDVPYMPQTPELCGGAAVAMVLRYWGERDVFPQDFAPLVSKGDGGILTDALVSAVQDAGWQVFVLPAGDGSGRAHLRSEIDKGRPLIALIEVARRTYHYVVIVGSTDHEVVLHDPARAPFRVMGWAEFDRAWTAAGRWMMLVLPSNALRPGDTAAPPVAPTVSDRALDAADTPCRAMAARGVELAHSGDPEGAEEVLGAATRLCPNDPAPWLELAGLRFSQSRWSDAQDLANTAVRLAPEDTYARQLLATSRYLMGDVTGALEAWQHTGEPRIDTVDIHGAERTRQPVIARAAGLRPRQLLTPDAFGRALRRLRDLPVASNARMRYEPLDGGLARIDIYLDERAVAPTGWFALAHLAGRALLRDELRVDVAGPLGAGELMSAAWRWSERRPRVALGLSLPSPQGLPGIVSVEWSWEEQSYDATFRSDDAAPAREARRRLELHLADWSTSWLRWQAGAALDRLPEYDDAGRQRPDNRDHLALEGQLDVRLAGDRVALAASAGWWTPFAGGNRFRTAGLLAAWRSAADVTLPVWSAVTEVRVASREAPLALWHGAGTGDGRTGLLRAHPLLVSDVLSGPVFGRQVTHGSVEYARPLGRALAGGLSIAGFVDAARAWHRPNDLGRSPLYVDVGFGVRMRPPGGAGTIRLDVARGLRGGRTTLSVGWGQGRTR
jgi:Peptidase_C39 like family/Tetratricopeptide repeat